MILAPAQAASKHMREAAKQELEEREAAVPRCIVNVSSTTGKGGCCSAAAKPVCH